MIILKTHFFLLLYQSGTRLASTLETQQASILLKRSFIRPCANSIFDIHNPLGIKLSVTFININLGIAFKILWILDANVANILNQQCISFSTEPTFLIPRQTPFQKIRNINDNILSQTQLTQTLLFGNQNYHSSINRLIVNSAIEYLILTGRFKCSLFN